MQREGGFDMKITNSDQDQLESGTYYEQFHLTLFKRKHRNTIGIPSPKISSEIVRVFKE